MIQYESTYSRLAGEVKRPSDTREGVLCIYVQYRIGCLILWNGPAQVPTNDIFEILKQAPLPFLVGVLPSGLLLAAIVYPLTLVLWDLFTARIQSRQTAQPPIDQVGNKEDQF